MATRAPIDLGRPGFSYGRRNLMPGDIPQRDGVTLGDILQPTQAQQPDNRRSARNYALTDVLSNPIQVESGSWGEAIAEALAGGIRGRTMRAERERELGREDEENQRARLLQDMQIGEAKQETADAQQQRQARDRYLQTLPENERARILAGIEAPEQPSYELDDYGRPYTIQGGQVQYGEGRVQMRPTGAGGGRQPPAGYRYTADGNLEAIPGGPADIRATAEGRAQAGRLESSEGDLDNAINVLNTVLGFDEQGRQTGASMINGRTTGQWADRAREWGFNQDAENLHQQLEPVVATLAFENLAEMRRNSSTGGALGSIAVQELQMLQRTVRSLATTQSPQQLRANAAEVRAQLIRTRDAIRAARAELAQIDSGGPAQGQQPRVIELDP